MMEFLGNTYGEHFLYLIERKNSLYTKLNMKMIVWFMYSVTLSYDY